MDKAKLAVIILAAILAASNTAWLALYHQKSLEVNKLEAQLNRANRYLDMLAKRVSELEENNTALILRVKTLQQRLLRLASLLQEANATLKRAVLVTSMLRTLNETLTKLYEMTFPHAFYTPRLREFIKPDQVGGVLTDEIGVLVFNSNTALEDLEKIYNWTYRRIENAPDQPFVAIAGLKLVEMQGKKYVYSVELVKADNYIQDALETLTRRAGDCEDKAILLTSLYLEYLGSFGDAWTVCIFGSGGYNHCFTAAYVKPLNVYVVADPTLGFYTTSGSLKLAIDKLFSFIGLKWSDVNQAIAFNNLEYQSGDLYTIIQYMKAGR